MSAKQRPNRRGRLLRVQRLDHHLDQRLGNPGHRRIRDRAVAARRRRGGTWARYRATSGGWQSAGKCNQGERANAPAVRHLAWLRAGFDSNQPPQQPVPGRGDADAHGAEMVSVSLSTARSSHQQVVIPVRALSFLFLSFSLSLFSFSLFLSLNFPFLLFSSLFLSVYPSICLWPYISGCMRVCLYFSLSPFPFD